MKCTGVLGCIRDGRRNIGTARRASAYIVALSEVVTEPVDVGIPIHELYSGNGAGIGPAGRNCLDNRIARKASQHMPVRMKAKGMRNAHQLAPDGTFISEHAAGTQYEEAEKMQYASPMTL